MELNKCGHQIGYVFRIRDGPIKKFCLACMFEKCGIKDSSGQEPKKYTPSLKTNDVKTSIAKVPEREVQ